MLLIADIVGPIALMQFSSSNLTMPVGGGCAILIQA